MPEKSSTTHTLMGNMLVVYQRERSKVWQCRFKVGGVWQRASTRKNDLKEAISEAKDLLYAAVARKRDNIPVVTRKFKSIALRALQRLEEAATNPSGLRKYKAYQAVISIYLIPFFGKYNIDTLDEQLLAEFDGWRSDRMGRRPGKSTLQAHNAALNYIFDEAVNYDHLNAISRPRLRGSGTQAGEKRAAFDANELLGHFEAWAASNNHVKSKAIALLLEDYVSLLHDTGASPGLALKDLEWKPT